MAVAVDTVCELETDKVTSRCPQPAAGTVGDIVPPERAEPVGVTAYLAKP